MEAGIFTANDIVAAIASHETAVALCDQAPADVLRKLTISNPSISDHYNGHNFNRPTRETSILDLPTSKSKHKVAGTLLRIVIREQYSPKQGKRLELISFKTLSRIHYRGGRFWWRPFGYTGDSPDCRAKIIRYMVQDGRM